MFGIDHRTMQSSTSHGRFLMGEFDTALREYARNQVYNPFRFLMFWNKDVIRGKAAAATIEKEQQSLLNKYRTEKSPEEIEKDQSILGHLVRSPYASDQERCSDMTTLMIGGHETSSYTLAWIFLEISRHPAVLTQMKKEIDSAVGIDDEQISQRMLNSMVYLDQVIKEGMRLWPVAGLGMLRRNSKDIQYGDLVIPKGSNCQLCTFAVNRVGLQVQPWMSLKSPPYHLFSESSVFCLSLIAYSFLLLYLSLLNVVTSFRSLFISQPHSSSSLLFPFITTPFFHRTLNFSTQIDGHLVIQMRRR